MGRLALWRTEHTICRARHLSPPIATELGVLRIKKIAWGFFVSD